MQRKIRSNKSSAIQKREGVQVLNKTMKTLLLTLTLVFCSFSVSFADFSYGDRGDEVLAIQKQLAALSYDVGGIDGIFGTATEDAVKKFQQSKGLGVDGIVGNGTYRALMNREMPVNRSGNSSITRSILRTAYSMRGVPYVFGGTSPYGFDCSGFTQYCFRHAGISIPRLADSQYYAATRISTNQLRPGDLVFFNTYAPGVSHVGIYVGDGQFIHASSSQGITVSYLWSDYWGPRYLGAGRVY